MQVECFQVFQRVHLTLSGWYWAMVHTRAPPQSWPTRVTCGIPCSRMISQLRSNLLAIVLSHDGFSPFCPGMRSNPANRSHWFILQPTLTRHEVVFFNLLLSWYLAKSLLRIFLNVCEQRNDTWSSENIIWRWHTHPAHHLHTRGRRGLPVALHVRRQHPEPRLSQGRDLPERRNPWKPAEKHHAFPNTRSSPGASRRTSSQGSRGTAAPADPSPSPRSESWRQAEKQRQQVRLGFMTPSAAGSDRLFTLRVMYPWDTWSGLQEAGGPSSAALWKTPTWTSGTVPGTLKLHHGAWSPSSGGRRSPSQSAHNYR